jgi:hypothetical protein
VPEGLDDDPFPERGLLRPDQVDHVSGRLDLDPNTDVPADAGEAPVLGRKHASVGATVNGDELVGRGLPGEVQQLACVGVVEAGRPHRTGWTSATGS